MTIENTLSQHYAPGGLLALISAALTEIGKDSNSVALDDLAAVEEFHVGGREASAHLLEPLRFSARHHLLDIGCGLGGTSRFVAHQFGCRITGVDLCAEFIETGKTLNDWLGLHNQIELLQHSAMSLPMDDNSFDGAYMLHVGMNIPDKTALFKEVARVLKPDARLAIYDLMRSGEGNIDFPVPWAPDAGGSFVASEDDYRQALQEAGFAVEASHNRHDYALSFYRNMQEEIQQQGGPSPVGLHLLMGQSAVAKLTNAYTAIFAGHITPIELIARCNR